MTDPEVQDMFNESPGQRALAAAIQRLIGEFGTPVAATLLYEQADRMGNEVNEFLREEETRSSTAESVPER